MSQTQRMLIKGFDILSSPGIYSIFMQKALHKNFHLQPCLGWINKDQRMNIFYLQGLFKSCLIWKLWNIFKENENEIFINGKLHPLYSTITLDSFYLNVRISYDWFEKIRCRWIYIKAISICMILPNIDSVIFLVYSSCRGSRRAIKFKVMAILHFWSYFYVKRGIYLEPTFFDKLWSKNILSCQECSSFA